jgi:predicted nucleic acid-binding protein
MRTYSFDADVLIYAATPGHKLGEPVWQLLEREPGNVFGSTLLIPELLIKPVRLRNEAEIAVLTAVLGRLDLLDVTDSVATLAVELGAAYTLKAADALHLATAVWLGADQFVTNNSKDFRSDRVTEIDVVYPAQL